MNSDTTTDPRAASAEVRHEHGVMFASRRGRLISAFVELAAEHGYDNVTIIEIVTRAGTSKRTFYEYFVDKQDCLLQAFDMASAMVSEVIVAEAGPAADPVKRIEAGVRAYLSALADQPDFARLFLSESLSAGDRLRDRWIAALEQIAELIADWRQRSRADYPEMPELSPLYALAAVSGLNDLVVITVHREGVDALARRTDEFTDLAVAMLTGQKEARL